MTNEDKAKEIANYNCTHICLADCSAESYFSSEIDCYETAMAMAEWKDNKFYLILACIKYSLEKAGLSGDNFIEEIKKQWEK